MTSQFHHTNIAVVGAGPVGVFFAFEAGMLAMSCHIVDALNGLGGQCSALYPEKPIYDIPGYPKILAGDLVEKLAEQAAPFSPTYHLSQQVTRLTRTPDDRWLLETSAGTQIEATVVVIAAGVGAFGPNRPPLEGIERFERTPHGSGVHYFVPRREDYRGRRVVIAGGGDSAVDWTLSLADVAARVSVVHRRDKFRAAPESVRRMRELAAAGAIDLVVPYQLAALEGEDGALSAVVVRDLDGGELRLEADALLPFYGLAQELGPIAGWGLELHHNHIAVDPATCSTGTPGVFAIGDVATYPGKLKLILTGFAEAAAAAHAAYALVHPDRALHFEYSTTRGVPAQG